jgi:SulP family sulfate permease
MTVLREGYGPRQFHVDAIAGLTVAIVALPLSMAIAIASGVSPERGLYTAIIGGFLVSALGGSRFQIGGPAGAFIVLGAGIVERHGYDGLALATLMAGIVMIAVGLMRLGTYVKYIPFPVTVGFTAGIAVIIFASQLRELLGLAVPNEPAAFLPKLEALWQARGSINLQAVAIGVATVLIILGLRKWRPGWPAFLIAITAAAALTWALDFDVVTIASRFGELPRRLSQPGLPPFSLAKAQAVLPDAAAIALLGAIESLLSAVVADGMSGRRHRSNCELVAQGTANIGSILFGVFRSPAPSRAPPPTYDPALSGRSPACFTRCFYFYSCLSRRRLPASCPWQHLARFWRSSPGTWLNAKISFCCSAAPAATGSSC